MYNLQKLTKEEANILFSDQDLKADFETVKLLSDDFDAFDEDAVGLDAAVYAEIKKRLKLKNDIKNDMQPKKGRGRPKGSVKTKKTENVTTRPTMPTSQVKSVPDDAGTNNTARLVAELLNELSTTQTQNVSPEQVEAIVVNILENRKICFEDLCKEVKDKLNETTTIKYVHPTFKTKEYKDDLPNLQKIIDDITMGQNVMLIGGAGTGKTFLAEKVASILGLETEVINCNQFTSPIEINGGQTIEGYQEGKLIKAWSEGKVLILDELPKLDPNTAGILNEALAKTAESSDSERAYIVNTRGDRFKKKEGFGVIATGNVYPNIESIAYGANNKQDLSLLDRFVGGVYEIEKNPNFEQKVILPNHLYLWGLADTIRTLIEENKWEAQISIRFMQTSLRTYLMEMELIKKGEKLEKRKTLKDVVDSLIYTFSQPQQIEIKRAINYTKYFETYQYRIIDINVNPY